MSLQKPHETGRILIKMAQCTAKSKRSGERCKRWAVIGSKVCPIHGGGHPKKGRISGRPSSKAVTTGRYSKFLPTRVVEDYEKSIKDPELLNLRDEIGVIDARLMDVMKRVDSGEAGSLWAKAKSAYIDVDASIAAQNVVEMQKALNILGQVLRTGMGDWSAWDEVIRLMEQRRKLVESERKRLVEMNQVITSERALILITAILDIVKTHVTDVPTLRGISYEVEMLLKFGSPKQPAQIEETNV